MAYFKIGSTDFSNIVNELKVDRTSNYNSQTNAAGNTVVDYINTKQIIEVGIIPLNDTDMAKLQTAINKFSVSISFRNPRTKALETITCIIPESGIEYYTIQANKVMYKAFRIKFIEL